MQQKCLEIVFEQNERIFHQYECSFKDLNKHVTHCCIKDVNNFCRNEYISPTEYFNTLTLL